MTTRSRTNARHAARLMLVIGLALVVCGCRSNIFDPNGERIFITEPPGSQQLPIGAALADPFSASAAETPVTYRQLTTSGMRVVMKPESLVAPVGEEIVVVAGVLRPDSYLQMNERIEWTLDGVGHIGAVDDGSWTDPLVGDFTCSRKIDNTFAVNSTSRRTLHITRGTPNPADDTRVLRGQAWVTAASAVEGVTRVTATAPAIDNWTQRQATTTIHWIDARCMMPASVMAPAGSNRMLTTTVTRKTNGEPRAGWIVRYEISGGPSAGFAPDGSQAVEVLTDENGRAAVEIGELEITPGVNTVQVRVFRPNGDRTVVQQGSTTVAWSTSRFEVAMTGPVSGRVGDTLTYEISLTNSGDLTANNARIAVDLPLGVSFFGADPRAAMEGRSAVWSFDSIDAGDRRNVRLDVTADRPNAFVMRAIATADGGLTASQAITTDVLERAATASPSDGGVRSSIGIPSGETSDPAPMLDHGNASGAASRPTAKIAIMAPTDDRGLRVARGAEIVVGARVENASSQAIRDATMRFRLGEGIVDKEGPGEVLIDRIAVPPNGEVPMDKAPAFDAVAEREGVWSVVAELLDSSGNVIASNRATIVVVAPDRANYPENASASETSSIYDRATAESAVVPGSNDVSMTLTPSVTQAVVGEEVGARLTIRNVSSRPITGFALVFECNVAMHIVGASTNDWASDTRQRVSWVWPAGRTPLAPGDSATFDFILRAQSPVSNGVLVTQLFGRSDEAVATANARVNVSSPEAAYGGLRVKMLDGKSEFVLHGGGLSSATYVIVVRNEGMREVSNVAVTVDAFPGLAITRFGTRGGAGRPTIGKRPEAGPFVAFEPIASLPSGGEQRFYVRVEATAASAGQVVATVTPGNLQVATDVEVYPSNAVPGN